MPEIFVQCHAIFDGVEKDLSVGPMSIETQKDEL